MSALPRTLEPPQVVRISRNFPFVRILFFYNGDQAQAEAAIIAAYKPSRMLAKNGRILARIPDYALGDTQVGDYVGEPKDRKVYYRRQPSGNPG
jgi:hypothetical protein